MISGVSIKAYLTAKFWSISKKIGTRTTGFTSEVQMYTDIADFIATINIAAKVPVNEPYSSVSFYGGYKPPKFSRGWVGG
jgi:translation elongation factor EF-Tu-like GTPase